WSAGPLAGEVVPEERIVGPERCAAEIQSHRVVAVEAGSGCSAGTLVDDSAVVPGERMVEAEGCAAEVQGHRVEAADSGSGCAARTLVGCGAVDPEERIVIVEPERCGACAPDAIGEIWISGPSVAQGYWNRAEESARTFRAFLADTGEGPFLRTGD